VAVDDRTPADLAATQLAALYERATRRLSSMLGAAFRSGNMGTAAYRQQQLGLAQAILARLRRDSQPLVAILATDSYARGAGMATELTDTGSVGFGVIHQRAVIEVAQALTARLDEATTEVGRRHADIYRKVGLERVGEGLIVGESRRDVSQAIVRDLQHEGVTGFVDRAGRRWKLNTYARMVARTTSREAVSVATRNRLVEVGRPTVRISDHDTETALCELFEGKRFTLDRSVDDRYPLLRNLPPFHPNCKHVMVPERSSTEDAIRALRKADSYEDVMRLLGSPPERAAAAPSEPAEPDPDLLPAPRPPDPRLSPEAEPQQDAETAARLEAQRVATLIAGDPGPEPGWEQALDDALRAQDRLASDQVDLLLGDELAKWIDKKRNRKHDLRRRLMAGEVTVEDVQQLAYEDWRAQEERRIGREIRSGLGGELRTRPIPCFVCGRFKRRPADVCDYCGDDPVTVGGSAEDFNRNHGYAY